MITNLRQEVKGFFPQAGGWAEGPAGCAGEQARRERDAGMAMTWYAEPAADLTPMGRHDRSPRATWIQFGRPPWVDLRRSVRRRRGQKPDDRLAAPSRTSREAAA